MLPEGGGTKELVTASYYVLMDLMQCCQKAKEQKGSYTICDLRKLDGEHPLC